MLEHYRNPHNFGTLQYPDVKDKESNIICGDVIEMQLSIVYGLISDIRFNSKGCAVSTAAASILTDFVKGKSLHEVLSITKEDMKNIMGDIDSHLLRDSCSMLGLKAVKVAICNYLNQSVPENIRKLA